MSKRTALWISLLAALAVTGLILKPRPGPIDLNEHLGPFFAHDYDFTPRYDSFEKRSELVTVSDGTRLAVDVFLPRGGDGERFPVILEYGPYSRSFAQPGMRWWERLVLWWRTNRMEPIYDRSLSPPIRTLLGLGYAYVAADMRGTGAAYGSQMPLMPELGRDGGELVDWIEGQTFSDGNVATTGQSFLGWSQFAVARNRPKALKCMAPALIVFDTYTEGTRPGGIAAIRWLGEYSEYLQSFNLNRFDLGGRYVPYLPAAPVVDEDGDGRLVDEIPLGAEGDPTQFADDEQAVYTDGVARQLQHYRAATLEHRDNLLVRRLMEDDARFSDAEFEFAGKTIRYVDTSPGAMLRPIVEGQVPTLHIGGWFDGFVRGTIKLYATMAASSPARLFIGPRFHIPLGVTAAYAGYTGYEGELALETWAEQIRFFDWCLKGIDNGYESEPPVKIYVMNRGWREEESWPLARQEMTSFFLGEGRTLSSSASPEGSDSYRVDFTHASDYGTNASNRWLLMEAPDQVMLRTELDEQALVYETDPLENEVEVTGHPLVHLWVSSDQPAADLYVYLSDVDENGDVHYVTEGQLRAGFSELHDPLLQTGGEIEVRPDLPWHGYREGDYTAGALAEGRVIDIRFDLMPTAWSFRAGHRIRISIAGADLGNFELSPELCPEGTPESCVEAILHLHRGSATPSRIELPIIPD